MSVSNLRHRSPGREHFVRQVVHRDVNHAQLVGARAESTAEVTTSSSTVPTSAADPASVKALIAFVVILGVALIGKLHPSLGSR